MPPKKGGKDQPKAAKVAVDKTFGMKNKKGGKGQQAIKIAQQQAAQVGRSKEVVEKEKAREAAKAKKAAEEKKKMEDAALFAGDVIVQPKVPFGADPKSFVCAFFKAGKCTKTAKTCKFSHDLGTERKTTKASLYADQRDEKDKDEDTMDKWSDEKLREVVDKHGKRQTNATDIVCKYFIEAVENQTFGYFWTCPNGGDDCKYRHALPPGFVLKSEKKRLEEEKKRNEISLEEFLDVERHKLDQSKLTPVTPESFKEWKQKRLSKKEAEEKAVQASKSATAAAGKAHGLSGRDLFTYNPEMYGDDSDEEGGAGDDEWDLEVYRAQAQLRERSGEVERMRDRFEDTDLNDDG